jgi:hypothetical protein
MQHYRSLEEVTLQNSWLTVGVFDGVHRGHQQIISRLTAGAHANGVPAVVLTFDPHPAKLFGRGDIKLLTLPGERAGLLGGMGVDVVVTHPFNKNVADTTAFDFMLSKTAFGDASCAWVRPTVEEPQGNATRLTEIVGSLVHCQWYQLYAKGDLVHRDPEIDHGGESLGSRALDGASVYVAGTGDSR